MSLSFICKLTYVQKFGEKTFYLHKWFVYAYLTLKLIWGKAYIVWKNER